MTNITPENFERLIRELLRLPGETTWVEFKRNNKDAKMIGKLISALSNSAVLEGKECGWIVWGIENGSRCIAGTSFEPVTEKKGNQDLTSWLVQNLNPKLDIQFSSGTVDNCHIVALRVPAAQSIPTSFDGAEWIRIGSTNRSLKDMPQKERILWQKFESTKFEQRASLIDKGTDDVLNLLDYTSYFEQIGRPIPSDTSNILDALEQEEFLRKNDAGHWDITNLGAILFARDLSKFPLLKRKAIRIIHYNRNNRFDAKGEIEGKKGYVPAFESMLTYIMGLLPRNEVIQDYFRKNNTMYPIIAVRELVVNALIHQNFTATGTGPMVEIFETRIEVTNPGKPIGDIDRLLDQPPKSRNEKLAAFMHRIGLCEERGSGVDKIVNATEVYQLPPPRWEISGEFSRATLFAYKPLSKMHRDERVWASYLHACLQYVDGSKYLTNFSLRERFGVEEKNKSQISRYIRDAVEDGVIKPFEVEQSRRNARYIPFWA